MVETSADVMVLAIPVDEPMAAVEKPMVEVLEVDNAVTIAELLTDAEPLVDGMELVEAAVKPPLDHMVDEPLTDSAVADPCVDELETIVNKP